MSTSFMATQSGTYEVHSNEQTAPQATTNGFDDDDKLENETPLGAEASDDDDNDDEEDEQIVVLSGEDPVAEAKDKFPEPAVLKSSTTPSSSKHYRSGYNSLVGGLSQAIQAKLSQVRRHSASSSSPIPGLVAGTTTLGTNPPPETTIKCIVHFLDDSRQVFEIDRTAKGEQLMELVFRHLELIEREYFALQFSEQFPGHRNTQQPLLTNGTSTGGLPATGNCASSTASTTSSAFYAAGVSSNRWLDPSKKIRKQMRFCSASSPFVLHFRVKFYVSEISRLFEEYTRYHFYLQIRKDILAGRLTGTSTNLVENSDGEQSPQPKQQQLTTSSDSWLATLASYVLQSELGDYCPDEHPPGYSSKFRFVPNQTAEFESKVESLHRLRQGQTPADAELNYLEEAINLDLYGVDLHPARDGTGQEIQIGVCASGLIVFKNGIKINTFSWAKIVKISFKRRLFFVQLKHEGTERFDNMIGFNLCSYRACKALWKSCVEQHTFFRLHTPKPLTKKFFFFFSLGSKFRYSGKTEFQTIEENKKRLTRTERIFIRNNARNATMPAVKLNDAQRHINNLRLTSSSKPTGAANTKDVDFNGTDQPVADSAASVVVVGGSCSRLDSGSGAVGSAATTNGHSSHPDIQSVDPGLENNLDQHSPLPPFSATRSLSKLVSSVITSARHRSSSSYSCSNPEMDHPISEQQQQQPATTIRNGFRARHQSSGASLVPSIVRSLTRSAAQTKNSILSQTKKSKFASKSFSSSNSCSSSSASSSSSTSSSSPSVQAGSCPSLPKKDLVRSSTSCDNIIETNLSSSSKPAPAQLATTTTITTPSTAPTGQVVLERIYSRTVSSLPVTLAAYSPSATISLPFIDQDNNCNNTNNNQSQTVQPPVQLGKDCAVTTTSSGQPELTSITCTTALIPDVNSPEIDSSIRDLIKELYDGAAAVMDSSPSKQQQPEQESPVHLVTITMKPDSDGRFGFNVKGGHDQNCPVLVSRVAPNTPADNALPSRLHEGDQVIAINGNQVAGLKHEEVVQLIRSTKNNGPDAELVLSIRPNGFHDQCTDCVEEPPFQYTLVADDLTLETAGTSSIMFTFNGIKTQIRSLANSNSKNPSAKQTSGSNRNSLSETMNSLLDISMNLLQEGLISESLLAQFEQLPRRNENMPITISRYVDNIPKNRYLDIAPYDSTRVVLHECITGDYINASYVNMIIPGSNITNRYIATQGPLKRTVSDFWQMVWEQRCSLIVMVTPLAEDGRKKCYKYWPDQDGQTMLINQRLELTMESCWDEVAFVERKFKLTDTESDEFHQVNHLQYLAWPDQGVPDDDEDFLKLINKVRKLRQFGPNAPVVVHCSAGIGRTGVLILMESGICLIEANQPIYPLELVRTMRNHRAMLIQTTSQFKFVCEALYHVYRDHVVQPLPLYLKPSPPKQPPPPTTTTTTKT